MTKPLFQLGSFQFDLPNGVPQTLDWNADYRWEEQGRLLRDPAQQFVGPGSQTITLDGVLFPGFSGKQTTMEQLRTLARGGKPQMFSDGRGKVYGKWVIKSLREGKGVFMDNSAARQIDFNVQLVYYGDDNPGAAASPLSVSGAVQAAGTVAAAAGTLTGSGSAFGALNWAQSTASQALTQQATSAGFSLGQLATIASTGAGIASQVSSGNYVNAALSTFGLFGFNASQASGWAQLGINAANLAQSYINRKGAAGMSVALDAVSSLGVPALVQAGVVSQQNVTSISSLLKSAATVSTILSVDPKITNALRFQVVQE